MYIDFLVLIQRTKKNNIFLGASQEGRKYFILFIII